MIIYRHRQEVSLAILSPSNSFSLGDAFEQCIDSTRYFPFIWANCFVQIMVIYNINTLTAKDGDLRLSAPNACLPKADISVFIVLSFKST